MCATCLLRTAAAALAALMLTACSGGAATRSDAASATPGVTVYGTADGGVGRIGR